MAPPKIPLVDRFWAKVNKDGPIPGHNPDLGPCWLWTGAPESYGYGVVQVEGVARNAHVVAYTLTYGPPLPNLPFITHICDNGRLGCVRPSHLVADTHNGNMRQAAERGRMPRGPRNPRSKLTETNAIAIRERFATEGMTKSSLAREYQVHHRTIQKVLERQTWKHVP